MSEKFIIDVDPGLDDARALVYAFNDKNHEIIAITTSSGNVDSFKAAYNAGLVATACNKIDIPIYMGNKESLDGSMIQGDGYYGANGMGNLKMFDQKHPLNSPVTAASSIVSFINAYPKKITLIMCGPLTNLARAYNIDPSIPSKINKIYVMGGDRSEKTIHNFSKNCEFNANRDPHAYELVFKNFGKVDQAQLIVFDWTLCVKYMVKSAFMNEIAAEVKKNQLRIHEAEILEARSEKLDTSSEEADDIYPGDELVIAAAFKEDIIKKSFPVILEKIDLADDPEQKNIQRQNIFRG